MPEINRKLSKSKEHPVLTVYRYQKTAKKQSLCYLSTILALITKKLPSSFNGKFSLKTLSNTLRVKSLSHKMLNAQKSASNQINSLNTSKNELIEIFRGFWVFEYALWQKTKTRKCWKSTESFPNKKKPTVNGYHYQKTAKKLPFCYLSTILALITRKSSFKLQW